MGLGFWVWGFGFGVWGLGFGCLRHVQVMEAKVHLMNAAILAPNNHLVAFNMGNIEAAQGNYMLSHRCFRCIMMRVWSCSCVCHIHCTHMHSIISSSPLQSLALHFMHTHPFPFSPPLHFRHLLHHTSHVTLHTSPFTLHLRHLLRLRRNHPQALHVRGGGGVVVLVLKAIVVGDEGLFVTLPCV